MSLRRMWNLRTGRVSAPISRRGLKRSSAPYTSASRSVLKTRGFAACIRPENVRTSPSLWVNKSRVPATGEGRSTPCGPQGLRPKKKPGLIRRSLPAKVVPSDACEEKA